jgi:Tfp pilus assembly protein PilE
MEWLSNNWQSVVGTLAAIVGMAYVPFVRMVLFKGAKALMSESFLKEMFISLAEKYVKSTKTKLDDVWFAQLKKSL